jgi:hypothetical protein
MKGLWDGAWIGPCNGALARALSRAYTRGRTARDGRRARPRVERQRSEGDRANGKDSPELPVGTARGEAGAIVSGDGGRLQKPARWRARRRGERRVLTPDGRRRQRVRQGQDEMHTLDGAGRRRS